MDVVGGTHGQVGLSAMKVAVPASETLGRQHLEQAQGQCGNQRPVELEGLAEADFCGLFSVFE